MKVPIALIAAADEGNGIGKDNKLPWHLPSEMEHFTKTTRGRVVIMGRKSFEAIGFPLKDRYNIVISSNPEYKADGILAVSSLEEALFFGRLVLQQNNNIYLTDYIFITGGGVIYHQALDQNLATDLFLTRIHARFDCDTFFPEVNFNVWEEKNALSVPKSDYNPYNYTLYHFSKKTDSH